MNKFSHDLCDLIDNILNNFRILVETIFERVYTFSSNINKVQMGLEIYLDSYFISNGIGRMYNLLTYTTYKNYNINSNHINGVIYSNNSCIDFSFDLVMYRN